MPDLTIVLAWLQTVAGVGSIIAAVWLTFAQRRWARDDAIRSRREFIDAATSMLDLVEVETKALRAAGPVGPDSINGTPRDNWVNRSAQVRGALDALLAHAPSDAAIVLSLTRCTRALDGVERLRVIISYLTLLGAAEPINSALRAEHEVLSIRRAELPAVAPSRSGR